MNHHRYGLSLILAGIMAWGGYYACGEGSTIPALVCLQPTYEFGSVAPDSEIAHQFVLTNQGSRVITISNVHVTCGCTKAVMTTNQVAAGGTAGLDVKINFKGRRGHLLNSIYVDTDDPGNPALRLEVTGTVLVPIDVQPEGIHFGTVGAEGTVQREVLLTATGTNVFHIRSVSSSSTLISAKWETLEEGKRYRITVSSEGPRGYGSTMASVRVETDLSRGGQVDIPVAAFVAGDIVAAPGVLLLIPTATNTVRTSRITLWSPASKPFKVTKVECPGGGMTATISSVSADRSLVEVKTWGALTGKDGASLRIETDLATMKEIRIPVRVLSTQSRELVREKP
ncbi:MAG: DUF1573 domain-containing protein [bacterium]